MTNFKEIYENQKTNIKSINDQHNQLQKTTNDIINDITNKTDPKIIYGALEKSLTRMAQLILLDPDTNQYKLRESKIVPKIDAKFIAKLSPTLQSQLLLTKVSSL